MPATCIKTVHHVDAAELATAGSKIYCAAAHRNLNLPSLTRCLLQGLGHGGTAELASAGSGITCSHVSMAL